METKLSADKKSLVITIPFNQAGVISKSGKSNVHASTNGNMPTAVIVNGQNLVIGLNAYTKAV